MDPTSIPGTGSGSADDLNELSDDPLGVSTRVAFVRVGLHQSFSPVSTLRFPSVASKVLPVRASVLAGAVAIGPTMKMFRRRAMKTGRTLNRVRVLARESIGFSPLALAALRPCFVY